MTYQQKMESIELQGNFGEQLVKHIYENRGCNVVLSQNKFDGKKDMTIDTIFTETKFQTPYYTYQNPITGERYPAFTVPITHDTNRISRNQLSKCLNVPILIFIELPQRGKGYNLKVYQAPDLGQREFTIVQNSKDGRFVAGFPIRDMKLIHTYDASKHADFLDSINTSNWGR